MARAEVTVETGVPFTASERTGALALRGAAAADVLVVIAGADLDAFRNRVTVARDPVEFAATPHVALAALVGLV